MAALGRKRVSWAVVLGFSGAIVAWLIAGGDPLETEARASTQQCNTACQTKMTDCILACDGFLPCEQDCKKRVVTCVDICSSDAAPAPPSIDYAEGGPDVFPRRDAGGTRDAKGSDARSLARAIERG